MNIFDSLFSNSLTAATISPVNFLIVVAAALAIGAFLAFASGFKAKNTASFTIAVFLLPAVVCVVIMMVNGNIGAGVAVAGAFSLVRFRSAPGSARDIVTIFLAMGAGLVCGMGYIAYAALFAFILGVVFAICNLIASKQSVGYQILRVTVPEDLNFSNSFDDLFEECLSSCELVASKTTNLGSLYKLKYRVKLKSGCDAKEFLDRLRERNGNLEVGLSIGEAEGYEL